VAAALRLQGQRYRAISRSRTAWKKGSDKNVVPNDARRFEMTIASELLQRHIQSLVDDNTQWQTLIADDIVWELAYAPAIGHPARLVGKAEAIRHVTWFLSAVQDFRFIDPKINAFADPQAAVAQVRAEGLIKPTGRMYRQEYVVFLRAESSKIGYIREYFDPTRAAKALDTPILDLEPW
jgi:ketosteroid isomerase-like protein